MTLKTNENDPNNRGRQQEENELRSIWLGIVNLFQTFEDLESVKVKEADIQAVREVIDEDASEELRSC